MRTFLISLLANPELQNMLRKRIWSTETYAPDHELMGMEHLEHGILAWKDRQADECDDFE